MCSPNVYLRSVREIHVEENHFDIKKKNEQFNICWSYFPLDFVLYCLDSFCEDMYIVQTDHSMASYTLVQRRHNEKTSLIQV